MWTNCRQNVNSKDLVFNDLVQECTSAAPGARLSYQLRNRLEKYQLATRQEIVCCVKDGCAPLFIACKRGHVEIVEYLLTVCKADIEQRGLYEVPDDRSVHCVTPLWCAAVSGRLQVIKCLIAHGAEINAVSDTGSTPVRSACFMTHLDIVMCLVKNGADILRPNYNGGTCLINSVQSVELCKFLLCNKSNVNARDIQNKTALHYAIQEHRFETTKLLLQHGADPHLSSRYNDDALQTACLKAAEQIFDYLVKNVPYSLERLADANELMGSTFLDEHNDTRRTLRYWQIATVIRSRLGTNGIPLPKLPIMEKRETFQYATEFTTTDELHAIALDLDALRIQSLLICERILGPHHKDTLFRLMYRGASYADALRYHRCIDLWRRALEIRVEKDSILYGDTCFTAQALVRLMIDMNEKNVGYYDRPAAEREEPKFRTVVSVFQLLTTPLLEARKLLDIRPVHRKQQDNYDRILKCVTHLIYLLVEATQTDDDTTEVQGLVINLVKQNPKSASTSDSLLHLSVSRLNTIKSSYFPADETQMIFPHFGVAKFLLLSGAPVNARNESRSAPLHVASNAYNFQNQMVNLLLHYGAHLDMPNKSGDTPANLISSNPHNLINLVRFVTLQCLAAQVVCKSNIRCDELPVTLQRFLEIHRE